MLPPDYQPPAADPEGERHVRAAVRERLRTSLEEGGGAADERSARAIIREEVAAYNRAAVMANRPRLPEGEAFVGWIADALLRYGPLTPALRDAAVEDVYVDGPSRISVIRGGRQVLTPLAFEDEAELMAVIKKLATEAGRRIDEASPIAEGPLPDGSRLQAVIPPVARPWPSLTIRKFPERLRRLADLCAEGGDRAPLLTEEAAVFWKTAIRAGANGLVAGPTGSAKTTLLNATLAELAGRSVVIEETAELKLDEVPLAVGLVGRPPNIEGAGEIPLRPLVRTALRMRPRRIVVGEARGAEALDLLRAMNTGHASSLATVHANSPHDALEQLVILAMEAPERPADAMLRRLVARTVGLVAYTDFDAQGRRGVMEIWELTGLEGAQFLGHPIFARGADGRLRRTGLPSRWDGGSLAAATIANGAAGSGHDGR